MVGQTGPERVERRVERRESRGGAGVGVGGGGGEGLRLCGSGGVNICSIPAIQCQGLTKALNMGPREGGERWDLRRS